MYEITTALALMWLAAPGIEQLAAPTIAEEAALQAWTVNHPPLAEALAMQGIDTSANLEQQIVTNIDQMDPALVERLLIRGIPSREVAQEYFRRLKTTASTVPVQFRLNELETSVEEVLASRGFSINVSEPGLVPIENFQLNTDNPLRWTWSGTINGDDVDGFVMAGFTHTLIVDDGQSRSMHQIVVVPGDIVECEVMTAKCKCFGAPTNTCTDDECDKAEDCGNGTPKCKWMASCANSQDP